MQKIRKTKYTYGLLWLDFNKDSNRKYLSDTKIGINADFFL